MHRKQRPPSKIIVIWYGRFCGESRSWHNHKSLVSIHLRNNQILNIDEPNQGYIIEYSYQQWLASCNQDHHQFVYNLYFQCTGFYWYFYNWLKLEISKITSCTNMIITFKCELCEIAFQIIWNVVIQSMYHICSDNYDVIGNKKPWKNRSGKLIKMHTKSNILWGLL